MFMIRGNRILLMMMVVISLGGSADVIAGLPLLTATFAHQPVLCNPPT